MPVSAASATIAEVRASTWRPRNSTAPSEPAMSTMQTAMKMALIRRMTLVPGGPRQAPRNPPADTIHKAPDPNVHDATGPRNRDHLLW